jgi:hypothetical protein
MFRTSDLLVIAGLGAVAYWLYTKVGLPGAAAVNTGTSAIANLFTGTSPTVVPLGSVTLPSGQVIPVASMVNNGFQADGSLQMTYGGAVYTLTSAGNGSYTAVTTGMSGVDRYFAGLAR